MVVGREWLKEVIVGQLDPWSALGQGQGSASNSVGLEKGEVIEQEQGRWEIWYARPLWLYLNGYSWIQLEV